ncbi:putative alanine dehydrogenase [Photobacterium sp. SKA34]|uniref:alanine dehydrogenase n=1 Tax=Photobacterium sp. SKA34 TaxID=121723 RepID=UPI00006AEB33|nr:alanine dehydrogenase [Photobacterium sp. SKA34]EAR57373.1 putative alanine dehydrogenase [Photobacterium sp. SKA34]
MILGVPKEIKPHEYRVGMTPTAVKELTAYGHHVYIETLAGKGIGFNDQDYIDAGGFISPTAEHVFSTAEMIIKVKEPQTSERKLLRGGQILFAYLHLAPDLAQTKDLIKSKAICIAYETVTDHNNKLPLLAPMSEVAGRMSIQAGAFALEKSRGGQGILLGGVPGVNAANVVIIGGGVVGSNAAQMAIGLKANVTIIDRDINVLRQLDIQFNGKINTIYATNTAIEDHVIRADLVIGGVLIAGAAAPKLITKAMIEKMKSGSAIVDVAIDQGGCVETSHPTTHDDPTYIIDDVVHYCVANMPGAVARTSTVALNNATLPYIIALANKGYKQALLDDKHLRDGLNIYQGDITCKNVALSLHLPYIEAEKKLNE